MPPLDSGSGHLQYSGTYLVGQMRLPLSRGLPLRLIWGLKGFDPPPLFLSPFFWAHLRLTQLGGWGFWVCGGPANESASESEDGGFGTKEEKRRKHQRQTSQ